MLQRIRRLPRPARTVVQVAALTDGRLTHRLLRDAYQSAHAGTPATEFDTGVEQALETRILTFDPTAGTYSFGHALLRDAADAP